jgi:hypothetical protein
MKKKRREGKPRDIRARAFEYALRAIKLYQTLQKGKDGAGAGSSANSI